MSGRAMTLEEFTNVLVASEIVPSEAVDDADGYDDGDTVYHIRTAYADIFDEPCARTKAVSARNDGGPAFPLGCVEHVDGVHYAEAGMTLRDYFAASAMQALFPACVNDTRHNESLPAYVARHAYAFADAMLAEREREAQS